MYALLDFRRREGKPRLASFIEAVATTRGREVPIQEEE
jgi:hypothetical protein